jgi:hypothetical protein
VRARNPRCIPFPIPSQATPTPTPSEEPQTETDVPDDRSDAIQNQKGTLLALGLAAFIALVAGTVVAVRP